MTHFLLKCFLCVFSPCLTFMMWVNKLCDSHGFISCTILHQEADLAILSTLLSCFCWVYKSVHPAHSSRSSLLSGLSRFSEREPRGATKAAQRCHTFLLTSTITTWNQSSAGSTQLLSSVCRQHCWLSPLTKLKGESSNWRKILDFTQQA